MSNLELVFSSLFSEFINQLIFLLAIGNAYVLYWAHKHITSLKNSLFSGDSVLDSFIKDRLKDHTHIDDKIRQNFPLWEQSYKQATRWFHLFTTIISVFPLLGILGTIWGIIPTLNDFSQINASFSLALVSTFLGIIFSIIFRFFEGFLAGNYALISERITIITGDITKYLMDKDQKDEAKKLD